MELTVVLVWTFIMSYLSIRVAKPVAYYAGLVDQPNERKHHIGSVPLVGGIAIFIGVMSAIMMFLPDDRLLNLYFLSAAMILLLGILDDKYDLRVRHRIAVQALSAGIMIFGAQLYLESFGMILNSDWEFRVGILGVLVTLLAIIGSINAFNMIDGIDGLAGMVSIITFLGLAVLFYIQDDQAWIIPLLFVSAICAYLMFNLGWPHRKAKKIFMGDAGAMLIGLTVVWLLVYGSQGKSANFKPVTALWIIAIPLMDMTAVMIKRVLNGQSPFKPDRDHLHHLLMEFGYSNKKTLIIITVLSSLFVCSGVLAEYINLQEWIRFYLFLALFFIYVCLKQIMSGYSLK